MHYIYSVHVYLRYCRHSPWGV